MAYGRPERDRFVRFIHSFDWATDPNQSPRGPPLLPDNAVIAALPNPLYKIPRRLKTPVRRAIYDYVSQPTMERRDPCSVQRTLIDLEQRIREREVTRLSDTLVSQAPTNNSHISSLSYQLNSTPVSGMTRLTKSVPLEEPKARANTPATPEMIQRRRLNAAQRATRKAPRESSDQSMPPKQRGNNLSLDLPPIARQSKLYKSFSPALLGLRMHQQRQESGGGKSKELETSATTTGGDRIVFARGLGSPDSPRRQELLFNRPINGSIQASVYTQPKRDLLRPLIACQYEMKLAKINSIRAFFRAETAPLVDRQCSNIKQETNSFNTTLVSGSTLE